jgi:hypothetical protein
VAVEDANRDTRIIEAHPGAAGEFVETRDHVGTVVPVARRRLPRPVRHLIAVGAEDHRPSMARTAQKDDSAHAYNVVSL